jgi:hypothetical protein
VHGKVVVMPNVLVDERDMMTLQIRFNHIPGFELLTNWILGPESTSERDDRLIPSIILGCFICQSNTWRIRATQIHAKGMAKDLVFASCGAQSLLRNSIHKATPSHGVMPMVDTG